ncbi:MAG TPA: translocation/assembly module TamB domain-containing protein, partial [Xanthomonadales bacterium]|nr:translocation/assembly module TamB domain-containing protein [Xanthomonadales bacterium]
RIESISAKLEGSGDRERFALAGDLTLDEHRVRLERFEGTLREGVLALHALRVSSPDAAGVLDATGAVAYAAEPSRAKLELAWHDVVLPADLAGRELATAGTATFDGSAQAYAAQGRFTFGPPDRLADIAVALEGDRERIVLQSLKLVQPGGGLEATGTIGLGETLAWKIDATATRFDPGPFLAEWPGALDFTLASEGKRTQAGIEATLRIDRLAGELRDRRIAGDADLRIAPGNVVQGTANLSSGESRVALVGSGGESSDVTARIDVATLADFLPGSSGAIEGEVRARGRWPELDLDADLELRNLFHRGTRVRAATLRTRIANLDEPSGTLTLAAQDVEIAAGRFDTLTIEADGSAAQHRVALDAAGATGTIALALEGGRDEAGWRGVVPKLELALPGAALALESPAQVALLDGALTLSESCFAVTQREIGGAAPRAARGTAAGRACLASETAGDRTTQARYRVEQVPIALVVALASPGAPLRTEGVLDGSGRFARDAAGAWSGTATIASATGLVAYPDTSEQPLLRYTNLAVDAELAPGRARATARAALDDGGSLDGSLAVSGDALDGRIDLAVRSLRFIELLSPEIVGPKGALEAHYAISGTTRAPRLDGALQLSGFSAELPAAGLELTEGRATLRSDGADRYVLEGSVESGEGTIRVSGTGGLGADAPMQIAVRGERVLAADIPGVKIVASPELELERRDGSLRLRGKVTLPSASINLARLPGGGATRASRDVVVVDEGATAEAKAATPLDTDVTIVLGD